MSQWSWKQAVADEVLRLVNRKNSMRFSLGELYDYEGHLQSKFPRNKNVRAKIRQTLQKLRDDGLLLFQGGGNYEIDSGFDDIEVEQIQLPPERDSSPKTRQVTRCVRLRNTLLAGFVKRQYKDRCQICRETIQLVERTYSEAHHLKPLGAPHFGKDVIGNILVLCPNHHVMFDHGAILVNPQTLRVSHPLGVFEPRTLYLASWHELHTTSLTYYMNRIASIGQEDMVHEDRN